MSTPDGAARTPIEPISAEPERPKKKRNSLKKRAKRALKRVNGYIASTSTLPLQPTYDAGSFDWAQELEASFPVIREELDAVLKERERLPLLHEMQEEQYRVSSEIQWKVFPLLGWGFVASEAERLCPRTMALVKSIPGVQTAMFSILDDGSNIPEHRGPMKGLLRGHLAMVVPEDARECFLFIEDERHYWDVGRLLIFDDTYRHGVRNESGEQRIVLLLHFDRPMSFPGRIAHWLVLMITRQTSFVRDARKNYSSWAGRFRAEAAR